MRLPGFGGMSRGLVGWFGCVVLMVVRIFVVAKSLPMRSRMVEPAISS